jgi:hypothetical protein
LARFAGERARLERSGYLRPATRAIFRHWELRLEAERQWHAESGELLRGISAERTNPGGDADVRTAPAETATKPSPRKTSRRRATGRSKK